MTNVIEIESDVKLNLTVFQSEEETNITYSSVGLVELIRSGTKYQFIDPEKKATEQKMADLLKKDLEKGYAKSKGGIGILGALLDSIKKISNSENIENKQVDAQLFMKPSYKLSVKSNFLSLDISNNDISLEVSGNRVLINADNATIAGAINSNNLEMKGSNILLGDHFDVKANKVDLAISTSQKDFKIKATNNKILAKNINLNCKTEQFLFSIKANKATGLIRVHPVNGSVG